MKASATVLSAAFAPSLNIWHDMMRTPSPLPVPPAIELTPLPLLLVAAMVPATWVPWSWLYEALGLLFPSAKLYPFVSSTYPLPSSSFPAVPLLSASLTHIAFARSSWVTLTPSSSTATTISGIPAVSLQASFTPTSAPATAVEAMALSPVFMRFHWSGSIGSLNAASVPAFVIRAPECSRLISEFTWSMRVLYCMLLTFLLPAILSAIFCGATDSSKLASNHWVRPYLRATSMFLGATLRAGFRPVMPSCANIAAPVSPEAILPAVSSSKRIRRVP